MDDIDIYNDVTLEIKSGLASAGNARLRKILYINVTAAVALP